MRSKTDNIYVDMQRYIAVTTIGPSTLRNQGASGVIGAAQRFLSKLDMHKFAVKDEKAFLVVLDTTTEELRRRLPVGARHWGVARKALNLFLRDLCYNRFLSPKYSLAELERWMEIPLDSLVAEVLMKYAKGKNRVLPPWPRIKGLTSPVSSEYQDVARQWADAKSISRPHLDMRIWMTERTKLAN